MYHKRRVIILIEYFILINEKILIQLQSYDDVVNQVYYYENMNTSIKALKFG